MKKSKNFEKNQKCWKLKIAKKFKNEVFKSFDFSKSEKFAPCLVPAENKGGISHFFELFLNFYFKLSETLKKRVLKDCELTSGAVSPVQAFFFKQIVPNTSNLLYKNDGFVWLSSIVFIKKRIANSIFSFAKGGPFAIFKFKFCNFRFCKGGPFGKCRNAPFWKY